MFGCRDSIRHMSFRHSTFVSVEFRGIWPDSTRVASDVAVRLHAGSTSCVVNFSSSPATISTSVTSRAGGAGSWVPPAEQTSCHGDRPTSHARKAAVARDPISSNAPEILVNRLTVRCHAEFDGAENEPTKVRASAVFANGSRTFADKSMNAFGHCVQYREPHGDSRGHGACSRAGPNTFERAP